MGRRIEIKTVLKCHVFFLFFLNLIFPLMFVFIQKSDFKRKAKKLIFLNGKLYVKRQNRDPLECLPDFSARIQETKN